MCRLLGEAQMISQYTIALHDPPYQSSHVHRATVSSNMTLLLSVCLLLSFVLSVHGNNIRNCALLEHADLCRTVRRS